METEPLITNSDCNETWLRSVIAKKMYLICVYQRFRQAYLDLTVWFLLLSKLPRKVLLASKWPKVSQNMLFSPRESLNPWNTRERLSSFFTTNVTAYFSLRWNVVEVHFLWFHSEQRIVFFVFSHFRIKPEDLLFSSNCFFKLKQKTNLRI